MKELTGQWYSPRGKQLHMWFQEAPSASLLSTSQPLPFLFFLRYFKDVEAALHAVKDVAQLINEWKWRLENINKITQGQSSIEDWEVRARHSRKYYGT